MTRASMCSESVSAQSAFQFPVLSEVDMLLLLTVRHFSAFAQSDEKLKEEWKIQSIPLDRNVNL